MSKLTKNLFLWLVIALALMMLLQPLNNRNSPEVEEINFSEFLELSQNGSVKEVEILEDRTIKGTQVSGQEFVTYSPPSTDNSELVRDLTASKAVVHSPKPKSENAWLSFLLNLLPFLLLIGIWLYFMRQMQGGGVGGRGGAMSFGRSRARLLNPDQTPVTFEDVAGVEEAKEEVAEVVEFLKDPSRFQRLGGKIPKGVLMVGPPGTGKTLLARAIAGEAEAPFFTISGSDFVEMFVGVGASRVRDMFEQAKKQAPCIIFIDEIDAVGRHRGAGLGGGHDEREQTLNQLLVEMDGFAGSDGTIVIAATNRPDVLDPALLRPGRFDRQVVVPLPDIRGRELILKVHMRKVPMHESVSANTLARGTPGFSGADLANLVNEATLLAGRTGARSVTMDEFEQAKDKILMGTERKSMVMSPEERKLTAYHESGHAVVGLNVPEHDPVHKVTIIPRGRALGVTMFLPEADRHSHTRQRLISQITSLFGGRVAEELVFGKDAVTTGAANDIERATAIARNMVTKWGLSKRLGPLTYSEEDGEVFLGRTVTQHKQVSDATVHAIDKEVRELIDSAYERARTILTTNMVLLHAMAEALLKYETLGQLQIKEIFDGKEPSPPSGWNQQDNKKKTTRKKRKRPPAADIGKPAEQH